MFVVMGNICFYFLLDFYLQLSSQANQHFSTFNISSSQIKFKQKKMITLLYSISKEDPAVTETYIKQNVHHGMFN